MTNPTVPPALAQLPQFTAAYWEKAPREKAKLKITRITKKDDGYIEFVFEDGTAFMRNAGEFDMAIFEALHVNSVVYVETFNVSLVTGMWVPDKGWVFRMTAQDLANYAKTVALAGHSVREQARREMENFIALALEEGIREQVDEVIKHDEFVIELGEGGPTICTDTLAKFLTNALEVAKLSQQR
ncbi:hypothetical protein SEA_LITTLELAF_88 [Mycobacterium phage LittleLaf]|uniref:Uncharacterized protein n=4 Tax=Marvinvirus marvin TaxID=1982092 RepID=G1BNF4_9CAUD|nr:hypothetical protein FDI61_gp084 [Mycobacterium phage Marvin]AYB69892.1 hypothetical protein SEA_LITTLELAF_88 [Mycobacterium phage LittleLaf]QFP96948.1 hypothetical protein SEA_PRINGAR_86 [Mycobacterium phage Pringar]QFP97640.1 hypothetical protein SEA_CORAZON_85 [Mycobacterium phage Corazon]URP22583.1 hypothetical protein SEA_HUPHLEPUFF_92 [Mycobacterium phage Huphlepuff]WAA20195.1 hypothetical protein SEA_CLARKSON_91 [Mycobacterium phage Clarkson]